MKPYAGLAQRGKGGFSIKVWETSEERELGESFIVDIKDSLDEAVSEADRYFHSQNLAAVEIEDAGGNILYHISEDSPEGERYTKTDWMNRDRKTELD